MKVKDIVKNMMKRDKVPDGDAVYYYAYLFGDEFIKNIESAGDNAEAVVEEYANLKVG